MHMASTSRNNSDEYFSTLKQQDWMSRVNLSEEARQEALLRLGGAFGTTPPFPAHHSQQAALCSASDSTQLPVSRLEYMDRTRSAPAIGQAIPLSPLTTNGLQRSLTAPSWQPTSQGFVTDCPLYSDNSMPTLSTLQTVNESAAFVEYSPADYVDHCIEAPSSSHSIPFPQAVQPMRVQLTPDMQWSPSLDGSPSPNTPSALLMTPVTQFSNPMSRRSSYNRQFLDISTFSYPSDPSCMLPILQEDGAFSFPVDIESQTISNSADGVFFNGFTGFLSETLFSPSVSASAHELAFAPNEQPGLAEDMRRSASTSSSESKVTEASSSASMSSRQSRREREINAQAASRKIAPKANSETESASSNVRMARIQSEDGSSKTVGVLNKTPYVRPRHPKIMCKFCDKQQNGFRGTHELERHMARAHDQRRKGYICIDYSSDQKFLASCKHCRNKKVYGAYYNAAAHLRRAHFHPRKRGKKGKNDEKRGGIGGGDDPPMDVLKQHWIREVQVTNTLHPQLLESDSEDMAEPIEDSYPGSYDLDGSCSTMHAQIHDVDSQQIAIDPNQYTDYMYDTTYAGYELNMAAPKGIQDFEFDAYRS